MNRSLCYVCQQNKPIEGDLICAVCTKRRAGHKICGKCGQGALVETMRTTNIVYYECDSCKERQMVQVA